MRPPIALTPGSTVSDEFSSLITFTQAGPHESESLKQLVRLAAKLVKADGSFLLLNCAGQLRAVQTFGITGIADPPPWSLVSSFSLATDGSVQGPVSAYATGDGSILTVVAVQAAGRFLGVLGLRNQHSVALIPSQEYVIQAIASDIAEHLEAERSLEGDGPDPGQRRDLFARLRLLESVVVNANDSILITEAEPVELPGPRILYANPAFTRTTGYTSEDVLGLSPRLLQGPLTSPEAPARIHAALKAWESVEVELLNYRKDGTTFWVELSISPVCDEKGWYTHWVSVQRDVTERKALESLFTASSSLTRARILLAVDDLDVREYIIGILGHEYQVESIASVGAAVKATMVSPRPDLILLEATSAQCDCSSMVRALRANASTQALPIISISSEAADESRYDSSEGGANDFLLKPFSARDLKVRVRTQLELQALKREIAAKEDFIRTTESLRQSEKLAVVGRLASSIAHEINNPLEAVINLLYLAESTIGDSEARDYVRQAQAEVGRAANIAAQTLGFHRQANAAQKTMLHEVLDGVLTLFQARPGSTGLFIERQYRTEQPVMAFEADLRQVFANLVSNAMDASSRGGKIVLRVRDAIDITTGRSGVRVLVADEGQGMSKETRQRVFEPFFTTKGMTGTGLGLWVSWEILRNHKATVHVRSHDGLQRHGTVFSIFFPHDES